MKLHQLFENVGASLVIKKLDDATDKALVKFAFASPLKVSAHYNDYPSIDKKAEKSYDRFFKKKYKATGSASSGYEFEVDGVGGLKRLVADAEEFFNDPDYADPGDPWSFMLEVTA